MFAPLFETRPILIVEDNIEVRESLRFILEAEGYPVLAVINGHDALAMMQSVQEFSLILLDMSMPKMDGREFLTVREEMGLAPHTPVLIFSASRNIEALQGVTEWIKKPVDLNYLLEKVHTLSAAGRC